jgi:hypothetical protein
MRIFVEMYICFDYFCISLAVFGWTNHHCCFSYDDVIDTSVGADSSDDWPLTTHEDVEVWIFAGGQVPPRIF